MPIGAKRAKQPDFSLPGAVAEHHEAAAQHYEQAARHHRLAAKHFQSSHHEKVSHHAHLAYVHQLHAEQHAEEAAKAHLKNYRDDFHEAAKQTHNKSGRVESFS